MPKHWSRLPTTGPLHAYATGFAEDLDHAGYTEHSKEHYRNFLAHLSRWMADNGVGVWELDANVADAFSAAMLAQGCRTWRKRHPPVGRLLSYLRRVGATAPQSPGGPLSALECLLVKYHTYLLTERGLAPETARRYVAGVRPFVRKWQVGEGQLDFQGLTPAAVTTYVISDIAGVQSAKIALPCLRSVLTFLHIEGLTSRSLSGAVPSVPSWRLKGLPSARKASDIDQMLKGCNRRLPIGRRDLAIITMLARIGLRVGEVARLELGDIDWRTGELTVRGKGNRYERLPLPVDVGRAVVDYLRHGHPQGDARSLFLRARAPYVGLGARGVATVVAAAASRAQVPPMPAHSLRHAVAVSMLGGGASLSEIGQVLRHRSLQSTAIYAKVDRAALIQVARPWPLGRFR